MDVLMPQLGETVAEGKITKWFKSAGDAIKPGDNLFEIETDKVSMEVPAITAGTLSDIRVQEGEVAKVGAVVAVIGGAGGAAAPAGNGAAKSGAEATGAPPANTASAQPAKAAPAKPAPVTPPPRAAAARDPFREVDTPAKNYGPGRTAAGAHITPLARRLAGERGIDLSQVKGSGPRGRIVASDIENAQPAGGGALATGMTLAQVRALYQGTAFEEVPLDGMRKTIATRLVEAKQTVPHFYLVADVALDALMALRAEANAAVETKISVNDFVIKALALGLKKVPAANAVFAGDRILRFSQADIGVAVAVEGGLLTPVIRNACGKSMSAISAEMKDFAARARDKKLKPAEYQGGASAVSNLGMYGVREFSAIINPPHASILAVGTASRRPVEGADGGVRFETQMTATLSCDHRVIDGALGAELLAAFKALMEAPVRLLI